MPRPQLKACPHGDAIVKKNRRLPTDYDSDPFKYLPPQITLSDAELDLARRYENSDLSGGYLTSQIAFFRRGPSAEEHRKRRQSFRRLKDEVDQLGFVLPPAYVTLVESDDCFSRLRHNNIWLCIPDELVPLPADPANKLYLLAYEGQGCAYWHLLLFPDGGHVVTTSAHHFGLRNLYPGGYEPDPASFDVYLCAETFSEWVFHYFAECVEEDLHYDELLQKYPGA